MKKISKCNKRMIRFFKCSLKYRIKVFILFCGLIALSSCNTHKSIVTELKPQQSNYHFSYDAMRRGVILGIDSNGKINKLLGEVQPDAAIATTTDVTSKLGLGLQNGAKIDVENATKITEALSELGQRTAGVNMLRDALYRLEEHCINFENDCKGQQYFARFELVVKSIVDLEIQAAKNQKAKALGKTADAIKTNAEAVKKNAEVLRSDQLQYEIKKVPSQIQQLNEILENQNEILSRQQKELQDL
ncbi:hypothetical protein ASG31_00845 [Chryseobacterium sp. Leaf404]|uniref:hypothetical protein n=1 Tax=unclassified Chryseobacterium TaxID=2593645 RepID=UPI0006FC6DBE|nr:MULTISPECIES: hypothetical protein [unclassified Chryseobacterium]KQT21923.1 hypothetical protein ASG31_00845 [Chryseobacterium sp. Leaf404]